LNYNWNWRIFFELSADGRNTWLMTLIHGLGWTLLTALCAGVIAFLLGSALGVMRTTPNKWAVRIGNAYVEFFRNIPLLVQLFLWYFVLPEILPSALGTAIKQMAPPWGSFVPAVIGLGLFTAARISEQVRAGIQALARGQGQAGTAIGLTQGQTYRYVLLPMAYRIILPTLTSESMNIFKNSSVTYAVGVLELYFQYKQIIEKTNQVLEITIVVTAIYFILAFSVNRIMAFIETRVRVPGYISAGGK
jgi:glutamate/aspartate transport system permease protein